MTRGLRPRGSAEAGGCEAVACRTRPDDEGIETCSRSRASPFSISGSCRTRPDDEGIETTRATAENARSLSRPAGPAPMTRGLRLIRAIVLAPHAPGSCRTRPDDEGIET